MEKRHQEQISQLVTTNDLPCKTLPTLRETQHQQDINQQSIVDNDDIIKTSSTLLEPLQQKISTENVSKDVRRKNNNSTRTCQLSADSTGADYEQEEIEDEFMASRREKSDSIGGLGRRIISKSQMRGKMEDFLII